IGGTNPDWIFEDELGKRAGGRQSVGRGRRDAFIFVGGNGHGAVSKRIDHWRGFMVAVGGDEHSAARGGLRTREKFTAGPAGRDLDGVRVSGVFATVPFVYHGHALFGKYIVTVQHFAPCDTTG